MSYFAKSHNYTPHTPIPWLWIQKFHQVIFFGEKAYFPNHLSFGYIFKGQNYYNHFCFKLGEAFGVEVMGSRGAPFIIRKKTFYDIFDTFFKNSSIYPVRLKEGDSQNVKINGNCKLDLNFSP